MQSQLSLFESDGEPPEILRDYRGVPGLVYCFPFVSKSEQSVLVEQIDQRSWRDDLKRRVQHYGYKYDYKARRIDSSMYVGPLPEFAVRLGERLKSLNLVSRLPDQMIVNEYLPGQGITPHVDCEPCFADTIVTVSLGSAYTMDLTRTEDQHTEELVLEVGSALVFSGEARYGWKHGIKPRKTDHGRPRGRRLSLTFRNVLLDSEQQDSCET